MEVARLVTELRGEVTALLDSVCSLPFEALYTFDSSASGRDLDGPHEAVVKTTVRTVVSTELGTFRAREIVREGSVPDGSVIQHSRELSFFVPKRPFGEKR